VGDRTTTFNAQRAAAQMVNTASAVNNQARFTTLLGPIGTPVTDAPDSIRSLPMSLRAGPLLALGLRVNSSPQAGARQAMTAQFLAAYNEIHARDGSTPLNAMARAGRASSSGITPSDSVIRGVNVQYTALFNGITDAAEIMQLGIDAAVSRQPGSAGAAVREGGNVLEVARQHGVFSNMALITLEFYAANSTHERSARKAAENGADPQQITQQFGLTTYGIGLMAHPPILGMGD
jgi:hypothetical protein